MPFDNAAGGPLICVVVKLINRCLNDIGFPLDKKIRVLIFVLEDGYHPLVILFQSISFTKNFSALISVSFQECDAGNSGVPVSGSKRVLRVIKVLRFLKIMRLLKGIKLVE